MSLLAPVRGGHRIDRVNPVAKILALVLVSVAVLATLDWVSATVAVLGELLLLSTAGLRSRRLWRRTLPVWVGAVLAGVTVALYGEASGATYLQLGLVRVTEGSVGLALATVARVLAVALPAVVLLATIDPTDLADGLSQVLRLPSRFVLGGLAGLRLVGLFQQDWRSIELARRARGAADSGRVRRLSGQALTLLVLAIRRGTKLATAMEARGFDAPVRRTWARPSPFGRAEVVTVACGALVAAVSVTAALAFGTWNFILG